eukprot:PhM_4_TR14596/c0_g1_i1/m.97907
MNSELPPPERTAQHLIDTLPEDQREAVMYVLLPSRGRIVALRDTARQVLHDRTSRKDGGVATTEDGTDVSGARSPKAAPPASPSVTASGLITTTATWKLCLVRFEPTTERSDGGCITVFRLKDPKSATALSKIFSLPESRVLKRGDGGPDAVIRMCDVVDVQPRKVPESEAKPFPMFSRHPDGTVNTAVAATELLCGAIAFTVTLLDGSATAFCCARAVECDAWVSWLTEYSIVLNRTALQAPPTPVPTESGAPQPPRDAVIDYVGDFLSPKSNATDVMDNMLRTVTGGSVVKPPPDEGAIQMLTPDGWRRRYIRACRKRQRSVKVYNLLVRGRLINCEGVFDLATSRLEVRTPWTATFCIVDRNGAVMELKPMTENKEDRDAWMLWFLRTKGREGIQPPYQQSHDEIYIYEKMMSGETQARMEERAAVDNDADAVVTDRALVEFTFDPPSDVDVSQSRCSNREDQEDRSEGAGDSNPLPIPAPITDLFGEETMRRVRFETEHSLTDLTAAVPEVSGDEPLPSNNIISNGNVDEEEPLHDFSTAADFVTTTSIVIDPPSETASSPRHSALASPRPSPRSLVSYPSQEQLGVADSTTTTLARTPSPSPLAFDPTMSTTLPLPPPMVSAVTERTYHSPQSRRGIVFDRRASDAMCSQMADEPSRVSTPNVAPQRQVHRGQEEKQTVLHQPFVRDPSSPTLREVVQQDDAAARVATLECKLARQQEHYEVLLREQQRKQEQQLRDLEAKWGERFERMVEELASERKTKVDTAESRTPAEESSGQNKNDQHSDDPGGAPLMSVVCYVQYDSTGSHPTGTLAAAAANGGPLTPTSAVGGGAYKYKKRTLELCPDALRLFRATVAGVNKPCAEFVFTDTKVCLAPVSEVRHAVHVHVLSTKERWVLAMASAAERNGLLTELHKQNPNVLTDKPPSSNNANGGGGTAGTLNVAIGGWDDNQPTGSFRSGSFSAPLVPPSPSAALTPKYFTPTVTGTSVRTTGPVPRTRTPPPSTAPRRISLVERLGLGNNNNSNNDSSNDHDVVGVNNNNNSITTVFSTSSSALAALQEGSRRSTAGRRLLLNDNHQNETEERRNTPRQQSLRTTTTTTTATTKQISSQNRVQQILEQRRRL